VSFVRAAVADVFSTVAPTTKKPVSTVPLTFVFDETGDAKLKAREATAEVTVLAMAADAIPLMDVRAEEVSVFDIAPAAGLTYLVKAEVVCVRLELADTNPEIFIGAPAVCVLVEAADATATALPT
jgi:hypothetical protein